MTAFNKHQPIRPTKNPETGELLLHRTFPKILKKMPDFMSTPYQLIQMRLYRSVASGEFPNNAAASETRQWLFGDLPTVNHVNYGSTIIHSLRYEARKLVNRKALPKPIVIYSFKDMIELQYGLEWQICTWLRRFLKEAGLRDDLIVGPDEHDKALRELATMSEEDYITDFEGPIQDPELSDMFLKMSWKTDWVGLCSGLTEEEIPIPVRPKRSAPKSVL